MTEPRALEPSAYDPQVAPEMAAAAPEMAVALDMVKLSVFFAAPLLAGGAIGWGWAGFASVSLALGLVLVNFVLGAVVIGWTAPIGGVALIAGVMGGYVIRLGIVTAAVLPVADHQWFTVIPFAVSLLLTHLGLLSLECRRVSATLAFPGLKPSRPSGSELTGRGRGPGAAGASTPVHAAAAGEQSSRQSHPWERSS